MFLSVTTVIARMLTEIKFEVTHEPLFENTPVNVQPRQTMGCREVTQQLLYIVLHECLGIFVAMQTDATVVRRELKAEDRRSCSRLLFLCSALLGKSV
jgi:hypothetical protein